MYINIDVDTLLDGELYFDNIYNYYIYEFQYDGITFYIIDNILRPDMNRSQTTDEFFNRFIDQDILVKELTLDNDISLPEGMNTVNTFIVKDFVL